MISMIERRSYRLEKRASVDGNTITGYIAVYNSPSEDLGGYTEMLLPGCFDPIPDDIPALVNHNIDLCIARTSSGTLQLASDDSGLSYSIDLPDTNAGRDLKVSVQRGDVTGCSFGFICNEDDWISSEDSTVLRVIRSVELIEVSVGVVFPAYSATSSQVRSLPESIPAEFRSRIEKRDTESEKPADLVKPEDDWQLNAELLLKLAEASL
jgi:HK97 family phage prohead protease